MKTILLDMMMVAHFFLDCNILMTCLTKIFHYDMLSAPLDGAMQSSNRAEVGEHTEGRCMSLYAIIKTGGKQYKVSEGDSIVIEKLDVEEGATVEFDQVLTLVDGEDVQIGRPLVEGAKVSATVEKNGKGPKIRVFKYKSKINYRKRQGHRQPFTRVKIDKISK